MNSGDRLYSEYFEDVWLFVNVCLFLQKYGPIGWKDDVSSAGQLSWISAACEEYARSTKTNRKCDYVSIMSLAEGKTKRIERSLRIQ